MRALDYRQGLSSLKAALRESTQDVLLHFAILEGRLLSLLNDEDQFGSGENLRHERNRVIHALNQIALENLGADFVNLCLPLPSFTHHRSSRIMDKTPWQGGMEITLQGYVHVLHEPIEETISPDRSFVKRRAKAWQVDDDQEVWIQQVLLYRPTTAAKHARNTLDYEGQLLSQFQHNTHFPRLLKSNIKDEVITVTYTFTPGLTLTRTFGRPDKRLDITRVYNLLLCMHPLCKMLNVLHRENLSHRYLTPDNIVMLSEHDNLAVIRDLGLAAHPHIHNEGPIHYQAPEQARADISTLSPGPQTDVYQLGAILYHFLTGRLPSSFIGGIEPPSVWNRDLPSELDFALLRALSESQGRRSSIGDFSEALQKAAKVIRNWLRDQS